MFKAELMGIMANGENSGVEDNGRVSGLKREQTQEWVLNVFRDKVHPSIIPFYEEIAIDQTRRVGVITISMGVSKPYVMRHNKREEIYVRMGDRSELAIREQQLRLFESGGMLHVEALPVAGTSLASVDLDRVHYYLDAIIGDPEIPTSETEWIERLLGLGLMAFGGGDKGYQALLDIVLDGPMVGRWKMTDSGTKQVVDDGLSKSSLPPLGLLSHASLRESTSICDARRPGCIHGKRSVKRSSMP